MSQLKKIFIVDDDAVVRTGLRGLIGYTKLFEIIGEASDGEEFLYYLTLTDPEFVILDLTMPGMYGTEVAKKALGINPSLKIIIFSANVEKDELILLLETGIFGYILKTEGFEQILKALKNAAIDLPYFSPELIGHVIQFHVRNTDHVVFTKREIEILGLMCKGLYPDEIAKKLFVSTRTVEKHRSNMLNKAQKKSTLELVLYSIKTGLVGTDKIDYRTVLNKSSMKEVGTNQGK
jgi:DNA-binding NarL/FixJ family response regulator